MWEQSLSLGMVSAAVPPHLVLSKLARKKVNWQFNLPEASHHGEVWEHLIWSFPLIFSAIIQSTCLDDQAFIMFATKVELIFDDRPLSSVSADSKDLLPLKFNTLLKGSFDSSLPPDVFIKADEYRKSWRKVGYRICSFYHPVLIKGPFE